MEAYMNYQKIYDQIIERGNNRILDDTIYKENHHVVPRCKGGLDDINNLVELTGREHFLAHWLLHKINPNDYNLGHAFYMMIVGHIGNRYVPSSRIIEYARKLGFRKSEEHKQKISESIKKMYKLGLLKGNAGKKMPKSFGEAISKAKKGMIGTNKGIPMKEEQKEKISKALRGSIRTEDTKHKISETLKNKPMLQCPYCGKQSHGTAMKFYHFENCKLKKNE